MAGLTSAHKQRLIAGEASGQLHKAGRLLQWSAFGERLTIFLLLSFVVLSAVWSLDRAMWVPPLHSLSQVALVGLVVGLLVAHMRWPGIVLHLVAVSLGSGVALWQAGLILPAGDWVSRLSRVVAELGVWRHAVATEETTPGVVPFAVMLLGLAWLLGYLSAWSVFRGRSAWWAVVPSGILVLVNLNYLPPDYYWHLIPYLIASLLLMVYLHAVKNQRRWRRSRTSYPKLAGISVLGHILWFGLLVAVVAWNLPQSGAAPLSNMVKPLSGPWEHVQTEFDRLFNSIMAKEAGYVVPNDPVLSFGGPPNLSERVIFTVRSDKPRYWRVRNYDVYTSQGWQVSSGIELPLDREGTQVKREALLKRISVSSEVRLEAYSGAFFGAGEPVSVNRPAVAEIRDNQASALSGESLSRGMESGDRAFVAGGAGVQAAPEELWPDDVILLRSGGTGLLRPFQRYAVVSSLSVAGREDLHAADQDYPQWVLARYLQLPDELPARIIALSYVLTEGLENPYDKVEAIQDFLLKLRYDEDIHAPPQGTDGVDHFLFDLRSGYCQYFSSAMAVMLRSVGVPSRLVVGYLAGEWDNGRKAYVVRERDYHAWTEVYFPDYGWVEFEATPSGGLAAAGREIGLEDEEFLAALSSEAGAGGQGASAILLSDEEPGDEEPLTMPPSEAQAGGGFLSISGRRAALPVVAGLLAALLAAVALSKWYRWRRNRVKFDYPTQVYARMCRLGSLLQLAPRSQHTPSEYAARLCLALPSRAAAIRQIAQTYNRTRYSRYKALDRQEKEELDRAWRLLRGALWRRLSRLGTARISRGK